MVDPYRQNPMGDDLDLQLAGIAHELWRRRLEAQGWRYGPHYCPREFTHDALVPFERLDRRDRQTAVLAAMTSGARSTLQDAVGYARGPDRPFGVEELRPGLVVCESGRPGRRGRIESWSTDERGEVVIIRVRWEDGAVGEHPATEQELARVEP